MRPVWCYVDAGTVRRSRRATACGGVATVGGMLHHFAGLAPRGWLDSHLDEYVVTVKLRLNRSDWPRHPDGSVDLEAFPERIFGPEHVVRHRDSSIDIVGVPERQLREPPGTRVLHRATCATLQTLDDDAYQMICGTRDELDEGFAGEDVSTCQVCLGVTN
jgi:hypothetical protein